MNIEIYTSPACGYCRLAKAHLTRLGLQFQEIDIARQPDKSAEMVARSGRRTVPQIFVDSHPVGGYDDLVRMDPSYFAAAGISAASAGQYSGADE
ncbi:MAG: glutaredoxin 3 [Steroidobacteraceae bacterium]